MWRHFKAWMEFLRLPNVLTVPGDVWAGAALAGLAPFRSPWLAVMAAYAFGMGLNDLLDLPEDRRERPERPLPSCRVSPPVARWTCLGLGAGSLLLYPATAMGCLLLCIIGYNLLKDRIRFCGPLLMAGCRMLAVWIGAGGQWVVPPELAAALGLWGGFFLGVTLLARLETSDRAPGPAVFAQAGWLSLAPGLIWMQTTIVFLVAVWILQALLAVSAFRLSTKIHRRGRVVPPDIGSWLRLLFPLQALVLFGCGAGWAGGVVLGLWPLLAWISRRMAMS
jgi:4-hydroxybenzoate polyprenyltransferase